VRTTLFARGQPAWLQPRRAHCPPWSPGGSKRGVEKLKESLRRVRGVERKGCAEPGCLGVGKTGARVVLVLLDSSAVPTRGWAPFLGRAPCTMCPRYPSQGPDVSLVTPCHALSRLFTPCHASSRGKPCSNHALLRHCCNVPQHLRPSGTPQTLLISPSYEPQQPLNTSLFGKRGRSGRIYFLPINHLFISCRIE